MQPTELVAIMAAIIYSGRREGEGPTRDPPDRRRGGLAPLASRHGRVERSRHTPPGRPPAGAVAMHIEAPATRSAAQAGVRRPVPRRRPGRLVHRRDARRASPGAVPPREGAGSAPPERIMDPEHFEFRGESRRAAGVTSPAGRLSAASRSKITSPSAGPRSRPSAPTAPGSCQPGRQRGRSASASRPDQHRFPRRVPAGNERERPLEPREPSRRRAAAPPRATARRVAAPGAGRRVGLGRGPAPRGRQRRVGRESGATSRSSACPMTAGAGGDLVAALPRQPRQALGHDGLLLGPGPVRARASRPPRASGSRVAAPQATQLEAGEHASARPVAPGTSARRRRTADTPARLPAGRPAPSASARAAGRRRRVRPGPERRLSPEPLVRGRARHRGGGGTKRTTSTSSCVEPSRTARPSRCSSRIGVHGRS